MGINLIEKLKEKGIEVKEVFPLADFKDIGKKIIIRVPNEIKNMGEFLTDLYNQNGLSVPSTNLNSSYWGSFNAYSKENKGFYSVVYTCSNGEACIEEIDYLNPTQQDCKSYKN